MPLLPDPHTLLAIADRIAGHARAAHARADSLAAAVAATDWHGAAAAAFDESADGVLTGLRSSAGRLEDAADALRAHARNVGDALAVLHRVAQEMGRVGDDVLHAAGHVAADAGSLLGDTLDVFR